MLTTRLVVCTQFVAGANCIDH